jgi:hypothetical protein
MAGPTITRNVNFSWNNGTTSVGNAVKTATLVGNATNARAFSNTQLIGTGIEPVALLDVVTTNDYVVMLTNKDTLNYVTVSIDNAATSNVNIVCGKIFPNESWGPVRMPASATGYPRLSVQANTGACNVEVICGEALPPA